MTRHPRRKKTPLAYNERVYRELQQSGLVSSYVRMAETDLHILAPTDVGDRALEIVSRLRVQIEKYIAANPLFGISFDPLPDDAAAVPIIREMLAAGLKAGVGPMAAVAGAIAEHVGKSLHRSGVEELIVENGGDIFLLRSETSTVAIFAGESSLSNKIGIRIEKEQMPCGVCCSSGFIGHSVSFGRADAVVVTAPSVSLADAAATRLGNEVQPGKKSIEKALEVARAIKGISGVLIIQGDRLGAWGNIELQRL